MIDISISDHSYIQCKLYGRFFSLQTNTLYPNNEIRMKFLKKSTCANPSAVANLSEFNTTYNSCSNDTSALDQL